MKQRKIDNILFTEHNVGEVITPDAIDFYTCINDQFFSAGIKCFKIVDYIPHSKFLSLKESRHHSTHNNTCMSFTKIITFNAFQS